jgi:hypothetical protein
MTIAEKTTSAILQEPIQFRITVNEPNLLHKLRILPKQKKVVLKPIVLGTLLRISKVVNDIRFNEEEKLDGVNIIAKTLEYALSDTDCLVEIIALAIINSEKKPSESFRKFIRENLSAKQMLDVLTMVVSQLNVTDFMNSIILVKGMSLINARELIARGESSEESKSISDSD